jgi:hypothetical protein
VVLRLLIEYIPISFSARLFVGFDDEPTNAPRSGTMEPSSKTIKELEARHGNEIEKLFGIKPEALTQSESQYILGFRTTDELRKRVAKARLERQDRLLEKGVSKSSPNSVAADGEAQFMGFWAVRNNRLATARMICRFLAVGATGARPPAQLSGFLESGATR